jgi:L,D-transpeptidase catalytic domain
MPRSVWIGVVATLPLACGEPHPTAPPEPSIPARPSAPLTPPPPALAGCATSLAELPASPVHDPEDPRLRGPAVLVAHKSARRLMLFADGRPSGCWPMGLGFTPRGHKQQEGDGRTPEGWYRTSDKPWSDFPGAIAIHYPNDDDATAALADGRLVAPVFDEVLASLDHELVPPQQTPLGGEVLIHGGGSSEDWTLGCMALEDADLARLRATLPQDQRAWLLVLP